mgnify:CR=1 FL=1
MPELLEPEFMRLALGAGAVVGVLAPAVGFFLVQRRQSLVGDGIGHVAFAGVAAGILLDISPLLTALVAAILGCRVSAAFLAQPSGEVRLLGAKGLPPEVMRECAGAAERAIVIAELGHPNAASGVGVAH